MGRRIAAFAALGLPPAGLLAWLIAERPDSLAIGGAVYGLGLAFAAAFLFRPNREVRAIARAAGDRDRNLSGLREELQARVELLSAEREISLVLNEDVDFRTVLDRVLAITCDAMGGSAELWMLQGDKLVPRARRVGGVTEFEIESRSDVRVQQCFEAGRLLFEAEEDRFHALAPLQADRVIMGVVRVTLRMEGSAAARQSRVQILTHHLEEFSKFLALAIKTPDLYTRAVEDGLTGLWTKRHFLSQAQMAVESSRRYGEPLSLIMVDVDHFKKVNDTHGHPAGDRVLKAVAEILRRRVRGGSAFRYGGEEMAVLLPKTSAEGAAQVAERLRAAIEAKKVGVIRVTASFGVAEFAPPMEGPAGLVEKADAALYRAKEAGRNRVMVAPLSPETAPTRRWQRSA